MCRKVSSRVLEGYVGRSKKVHRYLSPRVPKGRTGIHRAASLAGPLRRLAVGHARLSLIGYLTNTPTFKLSSLASYSNSFSARIEQAHMAGYTFEAQAHTFPMTRM